MNITPIIPPTHLLPITKLRHRKCLSILVIFQKAFEAPLDSDNVLTVIEDKSKPINSFIFKLHRIYQSSFAVPILLSKAFFSISEG